MNLETTRALRLGHRIAWGEETFTVIALNGTTVTLQDHRGELSAVLLTHLMDSPGFEALDAGPPRRVPQDGRLASLDDDEQSRVRWLEGQLLEVETGHHPDHAPETPGRPEYDPINHTLDERERAKVTELRAAGHTMSLRSLQRLRADYRREGLLGLVDKRKLRRLSPASNTDPRVVTALETLLVDKRGHSTVQRNVLFAEVRRCLDTEFGPGVVELPSKATLYRLANYLDRGRRNFVSEASRRTAVNRPERPFTPSSVIRPGEQVQIDTNTLDIMCRYADGVTRRAELTMAIDGATRSILTGIIAPTTKAVDAAAVLARQLVPEPMRPGWEESLHHAHSTMPHERLLAIDERLAHAAAKPVIVPETIVCDRGSVYMSQTFQRACRSLGISVQPARPYTPTDKAIVERTFSSINSLFCQHVAGYTGRDTTRRGPNVAEQATWTVEQLQELFDEWVVACWQTRPHEGLSHIWGEGRDLSPNEMFAICVARSGYVPLPLTGEDYIELLPAEFRTVNDDGITIANRTYDCKELNPYRRLESGLPGKNKRWEVHYDPYDVTIIWLRDHRENQWITVPWVYRSLISQPFGLALWEHARRLITERRGPRPAEADVARTVAELLDRAAAKTSRSRADATAVAVDANHPTRSPAPRLSAVPEMDDFCGDDEELGAASLHESDEHATGGFEVFDPQSMQWRL